MAHEHRLRRRVEFADTDCAGIIHFTSYFRYLEEAEHDFLRSLGGSVRTSSAEGEVGFPRLSASCEFLGPVGFEDVLDIHLWVERKGRSSITYAAVFSKDGREVARARWSAAACVRTGEGGLKPVPLPEPFASRLEEAPYPPLEMRTGPGR